MAARSVLFAPGLFSYGKRISGTRCIFVFCFMRQSVGAHEIIPLLIIPVFLDIRICTAIHNLNDTFLHIILQKSMLILRSIVTTAN